MKVFINQGCSGFSGRWLPKMWVVHLPQKAAIKFATLAEAKSFAKRNGASGKWVRLVRNTGPRQAAQVYYHDAEAGDGKTTD